MSTNLAHQNQADKPKQPRTDGPSTRACSGDDPNFRTQTNIRVEKGRLSYRKNPGEHYWTDVDESFPSDSKGNEEPWNVQNVVFSARGVQIGIQLSHFSTRPYTRAGSKVKKSLSEWQINFENLTNCLISEYKKKVILPTGVKSQKEFDHFVTIRFQCQQAPTCTSRTEYLPGDEPSAIKIEGQEQVKPWVPAPEFLPLALLVNNETNVFVGCEIRLGFRRFKWKVKDRPDGWMWPRTDGFLGGGIQYKWHFKGNETYNADLADRANSKNMSKAILCHKSRGLSVPSTPQEVRPEEPVIRGYASEDRHAKRKREEREDALATQYRTATIGHLSDAIYARRKTYLDALESLRLKQVVLEEELRHMRRAKGELLCLIEDADEALVKA
ncbi:hypothetical protein Q9189_007759 [Teloschistes chrysophthalmus]